MSSGPPPRIPAPLLPELTTRNRTSPTATRAAGRSTQRARHAAGGSGGGGLLPNRERAYRRHSGITTTSGHGCGRPGPDSMGTSRGRAGKTGRHEVSHVRSNRQRSSRRRAAVALVPVWTASSPADPSTAPVLPRRGGGGWAGPSRGHRDRARLGELSMAPLVRGAVVDDTHRRCRAMVHPRDPPGVGERRASHVVLPGGRARDQARGADRRAARPGPPRSPCSPPSAGWSSRR